jgi:hypothetical protein
MNMGPGAFVKDHLKSHQEQKMRLEVEAERTRDEDGAMLGHVASN